MCSNLGVQELRDADADLVCRALGGEESAFAELMRRHKKKVWGIVYRILGRSTDAEDAVQEVFMRAFVSLGTFDASHSFCAWIRRIAVNHCIDHLRQLKARQNLCAPIEFAGQLPAGAIVRGLYFGFDFVSSHPDQWGRLLEIMLEGLKPQYRAAYVMRDVEGRKYDDVAETLGVSQVNARVMVSRARKKMQEELRSRLSLV